MPFSWTRKILTDSFLFVCVQPLYNALIDTGALVTGMHNLEVAKFLLARSIYILVLRLMCFSCLLTLWSQVASLPCRWYAPPSLSSVVKTKSIHLQKNPTTTRGCLPWQRWRQDGPCQVCSYIFSRRCSLILCKITHTSKPWIMLGLEK